MTLPRFAIMLGIALLVIGGIAFVIPGKFLYSSAITAFVSTYGSLVIPSLKSTPSMVFYVQKAPACIFILIGLVLILAGLVRSMK